MISYLNKVSEFADKFDAFILDLWGVLHDGTTPYPKAIETLKSLREKNKRIIMVSNAPRRAKKAEDRLTDLGFNRDLYDHIITSGEVTYEYLKDRYKADSWSKYYYIGPVKDEDIIDGLEYERVENPKDAHFALVTGFDHFGDGMETKLPETKECLENDLPFICTNPDKIVVKQTGEVMLCAGLLADFYEENGGEVIYFGKPYDSIYKKCLELFNMSDSSKIAAIGDSLHTDIAGANNINIFSVLVASGILKEDLKVNYGELPTEENLLSLCKKDGNSPKAVLPGFIW